MPNSGGFFAGAGSPCTPRYAGAPPCTRVTFSPMRKSPKNLPEGCPPLGTPRGGYYHPPSGVAAPPQKGGATPGSTQKPNPPAAPRIESRECSLEGTKGKNKTDLTTNSKWQIGLFLWLKAARVQAQRSTKEGGDFALAGFQRAAALGAPLVTFPATGKSPGCRAWQSHALAERLQVGAGTTNPAKAPGHGAERPYMGE